MTLQLEVTRKLRNLLKISSKIQETLTVLARLPENQSLRKQQEAIQFQRSIKMLTSNN